jgi:hypothetical protein
MPPSSLALAEKPPIVATDIERVLITGDLSKLSPEQRVAYYMDMCHSLGLNPHTKPFEYLTLSGKLVLYARKDATEQLRKLHGVSITSLASQRLEDVFVVTANALDKTGRTDAATGAVAIGNLKGEALANALMKAETKAKRRATLSICGLGMLDETEIDTIPNASTMPPLVVEAPKTIAAPERPNLPDGHFYILRVIPKQFGGDIEVVDGAGETTIYPVPDRQCVALAEQVVQEGVPVALERVRGARDGKTKVKAIHRYKTPEQVAAENAALDAQILNQGEPAL